MSDPVVLFSGGKDSILTLKHVVEQGHDPTILHFQTKKISDYYAKLIKRNAMRIHRTPYYYTIKTDTKNYVACNGTSAGSYFVCLDNEEDGELLYPRDYGCPIYIEYFKQDNKNMREGIEFMELYRPDLYRFPLKDLTQNQIIKEWQKLPLDIKRDTISSTLGWFKEFGGKTVGFKENPLEVEVSVSV